MRLRQVIGNGNTLLRALVSQVNDTYYLTADYLVDLSKKAYTNIFIAESDEESLAHCLICLTLLNSEVIDNPFARHRDAVQVLATGLETELTALSISFNLDNNVLVKLLESLVDFYPDKLQLIHETTVDTIATFIRNNFNYTTRATNA